MSELTIVLVEDEPIVAADLARQLTKFGYRITGKFADGESAVPFVLQTPPDLLLMDINLAGTLNGIETVRRIQQTHAIPVIYLTANTDERTFREARSTLPAAFLSKPFRNRDLRAAVELAVQRVSHHAHPPEPPPPEAVPPAADHESAFLLRDRVFVRHKGRLVRLLFEDILYVAADGCYCKIHAATGSHVLNLTLKKFETYLVDRPELLRVHRSYLVNVLQVTELAELAVHIGEHRVPTSRSHRETLMERFTKLS